MAPLTALERFLTTEEEPGAAPAAPSSVLAPGAVGQFFVLNPISVHHPTAQARSAMRVCLSDLTNHYTLYYLLFSAQNLAYGYTVACDCSATSRW